MEQWNVYVAEGKKKDKRKKIKGFDRILGLIFYHYKR
jgi:hypothetical protein